MTWLAHHEFGLDHRPFRFDNSGAERLAARQPDQIDYWLELWRQAYTWLERSAPEDAIFVCYEDLCRDTEVWDRLAGICGTDSGEQGHEPFLIAGNDTDESAETGLVEESSAIYDRLVKRARAGLDR